MSDTRGGGGGSQSRKGNDSGRAVAVLNKKISKRKEKKIGGRLSSYYEYP